MLHLKINLSTSWPLITLEILLQKYDNLRFLLKPRIKRMQSGKKKFVN